jgi:YVTN family beta-propeller protein
VDPITHRVYVTSRDNNRVFVLDGATTAILDSAPVGSLPWGVAVNSGTGKLYVANFGSNDVHVFSATTLARLKVIPVGPHPTLVKINPVTGRVLVAIYGDNSMVIINGQTDAVERVAPTGGSGTWGLAVNPNVNRVYVSNRNDGTVTTLDGANDYQLLTGQTIRPCGGAGSSPFAMDFNPANSKLYIACAPAGSVNAAAVYSAGASGLTGLAYVAIGEGGENGGGGVAVDTATGNVFFTNSQANSVSVIGGTSNQVIATVPAGRDPFGAAVDPATRRAYVANRGSNDVMAIPDTFAR